MEQCKIMGSFSNEWVVVPYLIVDVVFKKTFESSTIPKRFPLMRKGLYCCILL